MENYRWHEGEGQKIKKIFFLAIITLVLIAWDGVAGASGTPKVLFVEPTPADGASVADTSVEIHSSIKDAHLVNVKFNWNGTDYTLYDESLVLMFNFDNVVSLGEEYVAGGLVKDVSGAGNDGYLYSNPGVPQWIEDGKYGGAFDFTGNGKNSGQSILVYHSESLNPGSGDFAIVLWICTRDDYDGDVVRKGSTNTTTTPRMWYKIEHSPSSDNNKISLNFNTDGTDATVNSSKAYNDNQWHFVIAQRKGNQAELWIDGVKDRSAFITGNISNTANLAIGSKDTQNDDFINSALDEVRIYMRSLSEDQIKELYYSNLCKYDSVQWNLYVNQSNLTNGIHMYQVSVSGTKRTNSTEQRAVTVELQCPYLGDANPLVNLVDFSILAYQWRQTGTGHESDINQDGIENIKDLAILVQYWLSDCNQF